MPQMSRPFGYPHPQYRFPYGIIPSYPIPYIPPPLEYGTLPLPAEYVMCDMCRQKPKELLLLPCNHSFCLYCEEETKKNQQIQPNLSLINCPICQTLVAQVASFSAAPSYLPPISHTTFVETNTVYAARKNQNSEAFQQQK